MEDRVYDEYKIMEKIAKGEAALRVLNDPVISEAYDKIEALYTEQLLAAFIDQDDHRWKLVCKINALREVRNLMTSAVTTAKTADQRRLTRKS